MILKGKGGKQYNLEAISFAQGGEGVLYKVIGQPNIVVKLYKDGKGKGDKERELKLITMVDNPPDRSLSTQIAWPIDVVYNQSNTFVGFVMSKLNINEDLNVIYEYGDTAKYNDIPWRNKIIIAKNLCVVLDAIHKAGHVVGDLNPKNISVDPKTGHIIFVDTDSYHITKGGHIYRCPVGMPEYIAPEVQKKMKGVGLANAILPTYSQETDNFALAIHIFQLLMNGIHPFACRVLPSQASMAFPQPVDNIVNGVCPFINPTTGISIPVYAPPLSVLPKSMQELFNRAFVIGHVTPNQRPDAVEWHSALSALEKQIKTCFQKSYHEYYNGLSSCPWCEVDENVKNQFKKVTATLQQSTIKAPITTAPSVSSSTSRASYSTGTTNTYGGASTYSSYTHTPTYSSNSIAKRIITIIIIIAILAGIGVGAYFIALKVKADSKKTIYISSASDFKMFEQYSSATYELTQDIDMSGANIAIDGYITYNGHFNGNGHKIYNFILNEALFDKVGSNALIENLILSDFTATGTATITDLNEGTINRVAICNGTLSYDGSANAIGGIAATNRGTITESYLDNVQINCAFSRSSIDIGGISGNHAIGTIENCFTNIEISVGSYSGGTINAGGLTGYNYSGSLSNSYSRCELYNKSDLSTAYFGGISGVNKNDDAYMRNCFCYSNSVNNVCYIKSNGFFSEDTRSNNYFIDINNANNTIYSKSWYLSTMKWDIGKWNISNSWPTLQWAYEV